jgi:hypothetical protein
MRFLLWALLVSLLCFLACKEGLAKHAKLDLRGFRENSRILVGKLPIMVTPRREYLIKAGASGLIELYVSPKPGNFKAGERLGGIDVQRLELDEELMSLSESLLKEKEIPQWHLQRKAQVDQLTTQLTVLEGERALAENMLADPQKYKDLFKGMRKEREMGGRSIEGYLEELKSHQKQLKEILAFIESDRKEELELGELVKKFELRKMQFVLRQKEAYLTVPFDGRVSFVFPYVNGEKNYVVMGTELALVRDLKEIFGQVPILDSRWRLLEKSKLELEVAVPQGVALARYASSFKKDLSGSENLIYSFIFDPSDNQSLMNQISGKVEGKLFYNFGRQARLVPKFLLVSLNPEVFRKEGWRGLVDRLVPDYELLHVGLQSVALVKGTGL